MQKRPFTWMREPAEGYRWTTSFGGYGGSFGLPGRKEAPALDKIAESRGIQISKTARPGHPPLQNHSQAVQFGRLRVEKKRFLFKRTLGGAEYETISSCICPQCYRHCHPDRV